jgi:hypothetical protein
MIRVSDAPRTQSRSEITVPPPEPFGQQGIGRFILPALAFVSLMIAAASATMWWRSNFEADTFSRNVDSSGWAIRSIMGRVLIYRIDFADDSAIPFTGTSWNYSNFPITQPLPDGWQETWKKALGVEWQFAPLSTPPGTIGGFWMRIRWRTIVILASILPFVRMIQHYRERALIRQRGFAVDAS